MAEKVIVVEIRVRPDHLERFHELILTNARLSLRDEPGCQRFDVLVDPADPRRVVLYEIYDDGSAFEAHLASPHYRDFAAAAAAVVESSVVTSLGFLQPPPVKSQGLTTDGVGRIR